MKRQIFNFMTTITNHIFIQPIYSCIQTSEFKFKERLENQANIINRNFQCESDMF